MADDRLEMASPQEWLLVTEEMVARPIAGAPTYFSRITFSARFG